MSTISPTERQNLMNGQYSSDEYLVVTDPEGVTMSQQQYREPPPYPGHSRQLQNTPGLRQSFSGSETSTDVSVSSTENLSTSVRQEPQGEENQSSTGYPSSHLDYSSSDASYSILARLGMPTTALEMKTSTVSQPYYQMAGHCIPHPTDKFGYLNNPCCGSSFSWHPPQVSNSCVSMTKTTDVISSSGQTWQLQPSYFTQLPPPPEYPGFSVEKPEQLRRSYETMDRVDPAEMSACKSQPDLTRYWETHSKMMEQETLQREDQSTPTSSIRYEEVDPLTARANRMIDMLTEENRKLRDELRVYNRKVSRLQKFEFEIQKVHEAYESLVKSSQKREKLESIMKKKLKEELRKLQATNKQLQEQVDRSTTECEDDGEQVSDLERSRKFAAVVAQNKELMSSKETLELEVASLRTSLQEQQSKMDILDNALTNAQGNVVRLEEECCKKQVQMERLEKLQKSFSCLKAACEKREQFEKQIRTQLEKEVTKLKSQQQDCGSVSQSDSAASQAEATNLHSLQTLINEKKSKILKLETEVIKWQQKYLEESALRQFSVHNGLSTDLLDSENLTEEKIEKLTQLEEVVNARQQVEELDAKLKSLQTELAEKNAMIRVFQRSGPMTRSSSVHTLSGASSSLLSPRPYHHTTCSLTRQGTLPTVRHVKTGSTSTLETGGSFSLDEDLASHIQHLTTESKDSNTSSEDDSAKIWQV
ncbi:angiomotin-like protein 1 isoform X2 [Ostrea edulis]|uniref:angiomotin-like protein 1 isoform X2 n=1 Tax=Ostrea edulis TaxID=37623 RepID=UPI0024AEAEFE|nr:angiomotin-like protein 1 isoform X2 [Ostrea edulis]